VELTIVNLDVVVTDRAGNPSRASPRRTSRSSSTGSRWRSPTSARSASPCRPAGGAGRASARRHLPGRRGAALPRHIVLFFDKLQIVDATKRTVLFDSLKKLLVRELGPGDDAMIVTWNRSISTIVPSPGPRGARGSLDNIAKKSARLPEENATLEQVARENAWFASLEEAPAQAGGGRSRGPVVSPGDLGPPAENRAAAVQAYGDIKGRPPP